MTQRSPSGKFISYVRVSTGRQRQSGPGLDAQRKAPADCLNGGDWCVIGEFTEVESRRRKDRPQLAAALSPLDRGCEFIMGKIRKAAALEKVIAS